MWHVADAEYTAPTLEAVFFLWLPHDNEILYANTLEKWQSPLRYNGEIKNWSLGQNGPLIPIDPHLALSLEWLTVDEMVMNMPYVTDNIKAALKLIKDIQDEERDKKYI
jgi:hypothetical protein